MSGIRIVIILITILFFNNRSLTLDIPATISLIPVKFIWNSAFCRMDLISVIIPNSVKEIGEYAFTNNEDLKQINIPQRAKIYKPIRDESCIISRI